MRSILSPLAAAVLAAAVSAQTWGAVNPAPANTPGVRRAGAMAFDAIGNRMIAYGGLTVSPTQATGQTWAFGTPPATGNWSLLNVSAPPRWGHRMVRNMQNNRLITFGGRSPTTSSFAADTWEYTGAVGAAGTWAQVATAAAPSPRFLYGLAFDEARNVVVLFGGSSATATFDDTWEYDGTNWTQRTLAVSPPPRDDMVMVYDAALSRTVLFGGYDPDTDEILGDTWMYDGQQWYEVLPANSPTPRFSAAAVYDTARKRTLLYGGFDGAPDRETWQFTGNNWQLVGTGAAIPPHSTEAYFGFDAQASRRRFVLYGGFGTSFLSDIWELAPPTGTTPGSQPGITGTFAPGCAVLGQPPTISSNAPAIATTLTITMTGLPVTPAIVALGLSNRAIGAIPLPISFDTIMGAGPCPLLVSPDVLNLTTGVYGLPIPNNTNLLNAVLYAQAVSFEATGAAVTGGLRMVIGN